jgi:hypothetical protein
MGWGRDGRPHPQQAGSIMTRAMFLFLVMAISANSADARTWNVRKDGTGDYKVIQDAVDHAAAGDTIRIGPGRFEDKRPYTSYPPVTAEKWTFDAFVAVTVSDLTIIGSGPDQTVIGWPTTLGGGPDQPKIICALSRVSRLVVEDLAMENVFNGIYRDQGGTLEVRRCRTSGCLYGVTTWSERSTIIEDCHFQDIDYGVISFYPARNLTVANCDFVTCEASFDHTANATVTDCNFDRYSVGCQFANNSSGSINSSTFTDQTNVGIAVITGSVVNLVGNRVSGGDVNLRLRTVATVTGWDNVFAGGNYATIWSSNGVIDLHGCQILHGAGPTVKVDAFVNPPLRTLDMTNNYWGTDSSTTISSWILDYYDDVRVYAKVQFEPFLGQPVPIESTSWGELKASFR